ncbi:MAG: sigma-70 family RNA polymerase sigma factor [Lachnospiraceae bacterium]|nr:sigma-70 family RNA polymerase sigma factor [Lachnospiraceae bacterium]
MEDQRIIDLFFARDEEALTLIQEQYGTALLSMAGRILPSREDAEEAVNDAMRDAWQAIPPHRPLQLLPFLYRIVRRRAADRYRRENAQKRGGGEMTLALEEWEGSLRDSSRSPEQQWESKALAEAVAQYVKSLKEPAREIFVRRYWYLESVNEIAAHFGCSRGRVDMILSRSRKKLLAHLKEKEWIE